ncbi:hypothetical protein BpHYR1_053070, partial [Brachionus plicatilis]
MKISVEKSCYMILEKKTKVKTNLNLKINGNSLNNEEKVKFLGITKWGLKPETLAVRSILKLKYDTPSNIVHQEAFNKLNLLTVSNRLFELSERYVRAGLSHSFPLVVKLVEEYRGGFESRYIEYPTRLCNCYL